MVAFEGERIETGMLPQENQKRDQEESIRERYGFNITFIEDNVVHVRDSLGKEIAFEFPMQNVKIDDYDKFVEQMQNQAGPPPAIDELQLSIGRPIVDSRPTVQSARAPNSETHPRSWTQHAEDHGISVDEMKWMYVFARRQLFERFKSRLRKSQSGSPEVQSSV